VEIELFARPFLGPAPLPTKLPVCTPPLNNNKIPILGTSTPLTCWVVHTQGGPCLAMRHMLAPRAVSWLLQRSST
jgi:hypothetical protein